MKINLTPSTKLDKNSMSVTTALTLDMSNLSQDDIKAYAVDAIVVKWQNKVRRGTSVPLADTYIVPRPGTRASADPETAARSLSLETLEKLLAEKKAKVIVRPGPRPGHEEK